MGLVRVRVRVRLRVRVRVRLEPVLELARVEGLCDRLDLG